MRTCAAPGCQNVLIDGRSDKKYCSDRCRQRHRDADQQERKSKNSPVPATGHSPDTATGLKSPPAPPTDAFRRLQGDAVLSNWKPHVTLETDVPDIPEFLRRTDEQRRAGWGHFDCWRAAHPTAPLSAYRRQSEGAVVPAKTIAPMAATDDGPKGLPLDQFVPSNHMAGVTGPAPA